VAAPHSIFLASSNAGKLREYRELAAGHAVYVNLLPEFGGLPEFDETGESFGENTAGKALHYSRLAQGLVFADDSGLVVPALGGAPGIYSARYAGPGATSAQRNAKLLEEMRGLGDGQREARFVCVIALAERGGVSAIVSGAAEGRILEEPRGGGGFGYDPIFLLPELGRTFAELSPEEKNQWSHRGRAFRKLLALLESPDATGWLAFRSAT
jgi:XTP/dITP diphosphohydrolase